MSDDIISISKKIQFKIDTLQKMRAELRLRAESKAKDNANYERILAKVIIQLKNGVELDFEGEKVVKPQTTIVEKIARGICWEEKLKADESEALYKSLIVNIQTVEAELNGLQSINRYLDKV